MPLSRDPELRARQLANLRNAPPAPLGHRRATAHGARATSKTLPVTGKARAIYEALAEEAPLRGADGGLPPADRTVVELLALSLARLESVANWLEAHGPLVEKTGEVKPAAEYERRLRAEARDHAEALGLTPKSRVQLGIDVQRAFDLAAHWAAEADAEGTAEEEWDG